MKPESCPDSSRFLQHQQRTRSQKQRRRSQMIPSVNEEKTSRSNFSRTVAKILIRRCSHRCSHKLVNGDTWSTDTENPAHQLFPAEKIVFKNVKNNRDEQSPCRAMEATRSTFEVLRSPRVESLLNLYGLQNSKSTVIPGRGSTMMEVASATPLDCHDYSKFRSTIGKLIFTALWRPDLQFAIQRLSTQVLNPTTQSKRAMKQLIRYLTGTQHRETPELDGRSDSDWAGDSATRQSVPEYHCDGQYVT